MRNPLDLGGRAVLVTGASSELGRAVAVALSRLGARVVAAGRRADALEETVRAMENPAAHRAEVFDLADVDGIPKWVKQVRETLGEPLGGLVHAAGVSDAMPLRIMDRGRMDRVLLPNLYAALALLRGFAARGVGADGGSVVLLSSVSGLAGAPGHTAYGASKGALHSLARSAAHELAPRRMRVNCVAPAWVRSATLERAGDLAGADMGRQFLGPVEPDDVATGVAYLLSDAARSVTGTTLVMDGGWTC
jgi:NAD(P)-dependent dehydrogenase (short-subunit alcohol dehydrogenase family)